MIYIMNPPYTSTGGGGSGEGDMLKAVYDTKNLQKDVYKRYTNTITSDTVNPTPRVHHLLNASAGVINITLPEVLAGDDRWYSFTMQRDSNHVYYSVDQGIQRLNDALTVSHSTVNSSIEVVANGVDGYDVLGDTRLYNRPRTVTSNISYLSGFESGAVYEGIIPDATEVVFTINNWTLNNKGDFAEFIKVSGANSTFKVQSLDGTFSEIITNNNTGFKLYVSSDPVIGYVVMNDSRPDAGSETLQFLPKIATSVYEPAYAGVLETQSFSSTTFTTPQITSELSGSPTSLGFFINDNRALIGLVEEREITAYAVLAKSSAFNRDVRIKFKYYEYDYNTEILNPTPLSETAYSSTIDNTVVETRQIAGVLPANTWALEDEGSTKTLVIELLAYKTAGAGDNPTLDISSGSLAESRTSIAVANASSNHDAGGGVSQTGNLIRYGHVDNTQLMQLPEITTAVRDATPSKRGGMFAYNTDNDALEYLDASLAVQTVATGATELTVNAVDTFTSAGLIGVLTSAGVETASPTEPLCEKNQLVVLKSSVTAGNPVTVVLNGIANIKNFVVLNTDLGEPVYAGTNGDPTLVEPTGSGAIIREIGTVVDTNKILVNPKQSITLNV